MKAFVLLVMFVHVRLISITLVYDIVERIAQTPQPLLSTRAVLDQSQSNLSLLL
jgi:cytoskeletal protein RodZ